MVALFLLAMMSYSYFLNGPGNVNTISRVALALAIAEHGTVEIDDLADATIDKAVFEGHSYSDKAPGMSLMALPVVYVATRAMRLAGLPMVWVDGEQMTLQFGLVSYLAAVFTSGLPTALAVVALYWLATQLGAARGGAAFAALAFGLGTPAWGWATAFFGHATSGALQFLALALIFQLDRTAAPGSSMRRRDMLLAAAIGLLLGWSVVVEFIAAPSAAMIALYALVRLGRRQPPPWLAQAGGAALAGVLPAAAALLIYNDLAFGSPFVLGYSHVAGFEGMQQGFYGIRLPDGTVAIRILFGEYRGLLWISPILLLVPWALVRLFRIRHQRALALLIFGIIACYVLLNASYFYWDGGQSTGPRHVTPILPFVCLPLSLLWTGASRAGRVALGGLLGLSVALSLICVAVGMMAPQTTPRLLRDFLLPQFAAGNLQGVILSRLALLPGLVSLLPLVLAWGAVGILWALWVRQPRYATLG